MRKKMASKSLLKIFTTLIAIEIAKAEISNEISSHRTQVLSSEGVAIEGRWIAKLDTDNCGAAQEAINDLKASTPQALASKYSGVDAKSSKINTLCLVTFSGDNSFKDLVLSTVPNVIYVEADKEVTTLNSIRSWGLDRIDQPYLPLDKNDFRGSHSGKGVNVYVVDTGIYVEHNDFEGRAVHGADFSTDEDQADLYGHGTHCAGTIGGKLYGAAKKVNIISVKVLNSQGSGSWSSVISGVEWSLQNSTDSENVVVPGVISMSLGGGYTQSVNDVVNAVSNSGMIVVVAAGNSDDDSCLYSPASSGGNGKQGGVITVGATTSDDHRSYFSNWGTCTDIFAPGTSITSTWINNGPDGSHTISGTSMACPHVAGVAAALLHKHNMSKDEAIRELFDLAVKDVIYFEADGLRNTSPNLLLQVPFHENATHAPHAFNYTYPPSDWEEPCESLSRRKCKKHYDRCYLEKVPGKKRKQCFTIPSYPTSVPVAYPTMSPGYDFCESLNRKQCKAYPDQCTLETVPGKRKKQCFSIRTVAPTTPTSPTVPEEESCGFGDFSHAESYCQGIGKRLCDVHDYYDSDGFPADGWCNKLLYSRVWVAAYDFCDSNAKMATYEAGHDRTFCALQHSIQFFVCCPYN